MEVNSIRYENQVMTICCSGEFGIGSEGQPSSGLLFDRVTRWIDDHPDEPVKVIELDFRSVDYRWADGPISAMVGVIARHGVSSVRIIASASNAQSLSGLVETSKMPWFSVVDADALQAHAADMLQRHAACGATHALPRKQLMRIPFDVQEAV